MTEYQLLQHMHPQMSMYPPHQYFIPHHGVTKDSSSSTNCVVFDVSAKISNQISLNYVLALNYKGILLKICLDTCKKYHQILIKVFYGAIHLSVETHIISNITYGILALQFL